MIYIYIYIHVYTHTCRDTCILHTYSLHTYRHICDGILASAAIDSAEANGPVSVIMARCRWLSFMGACNVGAFS